MQLLPFMVGILSGVAIGRFFFFRRLPTIVLTVAFVGGWILWMLASYAELIEPLGATGRLFFFSLGVSLCGELLYLSMRRVDELEEKNDRLSRDLAAERDKARTRSST